MTTTLEGAFEKNGSPRPTRRRTIAGNSQNLAEEIAALPSLDPSTFKERWLSLFGAEPPPGLSRAFLTRALAYRIQERAFGGLKPTLKKFLAEVEGRSAKGQSSPAFGSASVRPGTVLLRDWRGTRHRVIARENGFEWNGGQYRSLSEVARGISGTRWSGPRFFGLTTRAEASRGQPS